MNLAPTVDYMDAARVLSGPEQINKALQRAHQQGYELGFRCATLAPPEESLMPRDIAYGRVVRRRDTEILELRGKLARVLSVLEPAACVCSRHYVCTRCLALAAIPWQTDRPAQPKTPEAPATTMREGQESEVNSPAEKGDD